MANVNYTASEVNAIATTINSQINATTERTVIWSWGVSKRVATLYNNMPALGLRVSGLIFKGWVYVCYNEGTDTYELRFVNMKGVVKKSIDDVYCDMLGEIIDRNVERGNFSEDVYYKKAMADSRARL